eukprot:11833697-Alexandrium_andersonii.AAC.3
MRGQTVSTDLWTTQLPSGCDFLQRTQTRKSCGSRTGATRGSISMMGMSAATTSAMKGSHFMGSGKARRRSNPASPAPRFRPPASGDSEGRGRDRLLPGEPPALTGAPSAPWANGDGPASEGAPWRRPKDRRRPTASGPALGLPAAVPPEAAPAEAAPSRSKGGAGPW